MWISSKTGSEFFTASSDGTVIGHHHHPDILTTWVCSGSLVGHEELHWAGGQAGPGPVPRGREQREQGPGGQYPRVWVDHSFQIHGGHSTGWDSELRMCVAFWHMTNVQLSRYSYLHLSVAFCIVWSCCTVNTPKLLFDKYKYHSSRICWKQKIFKSLSTLFQHYCIAFFLNFSSFHIISRHYTAIVIRFEFWNTRKGNLLS